MDAARRAPRRAGPRPVRRAWGCSPAPLADAVGPTGQVVAVESDPEAAEHARANLADQPNVAVLTARVDDAFGVARPARRGSAKQRGSRPRKASRSTLMPTAADVVVLDPPRTGAGRGVCAEIAALRPRVVVYVACDPAALARDTAYLADLGYRLDGLRAFDAVPDDAPRGVRRALRAGLRPGRRPPVSRVGTPRHRLDPIDPVWLDILTSR